MIVTTKIKSEIGTITAGATEEGLCLLEFDNMKRLDSECRELKHYFKTEIIEGENIHLKTVRCELTEYFNGSLKEFTVPIVTAGSLFQKSVWDELLKIPYGTTRTYHEQSVALGAPLAIRAVANANGKNRIAIIIPCHRVIGSNGKLTGYGGGIERKKWLLDHENKHSGIKRELLLF